MENKFDSKELNNLNCSNKYILNKDDTVSIITNATSKHNSGNLVDKNNNICGEMCFKSFEEPFIDNNKELIMHIKDKRITYDKSKNNTKYFKIYTKGDKGKTYKLHRTIYEFITKTKIEKGYEIDHFNSNQQDNRFNNLIKLPAELHKSKLKSIDEFYIPYTINLKMNDSKSKFMIVLMDLGIRKFKESGGKDKFGKIYEYNYIICLEYDDVNKLINDLDLFKNESKLPINKNINSKLTEFKDMIGDKDDILSYKIKHLSKSKNAVNIRKLKMTEKRLDDVFKKYIIHNILTGCDSKIKFNDINNCILDFNIFNMNDKELNEIGLILNK